MDQNLKTIIRELAAVVLLLYLLEWSCSPGALWAQSRVIPRGAPATPSGNPSGSGTTRPPSPAGPVSVTFKDNRLSVEARDSDLRTVIERIASQGNIDVRHLDGLASTRVSVRFADLPVAEGLKRIFRAAEVSGYALVTETAGENLQVQRILFLPALGGPAGVRPASTAARRPPGVPQPMVAPVAPAEPQQDSESGEPVALSSSGSVFEDLKTNTTARRLLSQLVHPNEQVRERALESLIQLVGEDQKQAQLLELLEPLMDDMASEDKAAREDARAEIRKLLSR